MEDDAYGQVSIDRCTGYPDYIRTVALVSIAISQKRQADSMDKLGVPPAFEDQLAAFAGVINR